MLPFRTLIVINRKAATPVYRQIANSVMSLIRNGILKPGAPLPSSREMALLLKVHRKTIVAAYDELDAFSYTISHDLKNPLTTIKSYAQLLMRNFTFEPKAKQMLEEH